MVAKGAGEACHHILEAQSDWEHFKENGNSILSGSLLKVLLAEALALKASLKTVSNLEVTLWRLE